MITLRFKYNGKTREFKEEKYSTIYYQVGELLNAGEPTFEEDMYIQQMEEFDREKYLNLTDEDFEKSIEYWEDLKEKITEETYRDFISTALEGSRVFQYDIIAD